MIFSPFYIMNLNENLYLSKIKKINYITLKFKKDININHFSFNSKLFIKITSYDILLRYLLIKFLKRSFISEFSGFLLYQKISQFLKKTDYNLIDCFEYLARDEARHSGFLNKVIFQYNSQFDYKNSLKIKNPIFFPFKFILYSTYFSELIGYWRYNIIFQYLKKNENYKISSLFDFFKNWCLDEKLHSEFLSILLSSKKKFINKIGKKLYIFFALTVILTMYIKDFNSSSFYSYIGINSTNFSKLVVIKMLQTVFLPLKNLKTLNFFNTLEKFIIILNTFNNVYASKKYLINNMYYIISMFYLRLKLFYLIYNLYFLYL